MLVRVIKMKNKTAKRNIRLIGFVLAIVMIIAIGRELYDTISINYRISVAQAENEQLAKESERLQNEVKKLQDDNYIQSYVSGTIFSTEKGTSIYVLPEDEKAPE